MLAVTGFLWPGIVGALLFRAWTLALVAWVVLAARAIEAPSGFPGGVTPASAVA